jgi:antitoxin YefM
MSSVYTYTQARENLATILDAVSKNNEVIIINRRNAENVALISESELNSLLETAHLLRSPKNASRLMGAIADALADKVSVQSIDDLKKEVGLE